MSDEKRSARRILRQYRNSSLATPNADGSPLEGYVEHPAPGDTVERSFTMSGWHTWHQRPVAAVVVELNGEFLGRAQASGRRSDVAASRGDDRYATAGWTVDLDVGHVHTETAELKVTVFAVADRAGVELEPITVTVGGQATVDLDGTPIPPLDEVFGNIDVPVPNSTVERGVVTIKGWTTSRYAPIARVTLYADDVHLGAARLGLDRDDVAATDPAADAPICGFEQLLDLSSLPDATRSVTIRAVAVSRNGIEGAFTCELSVRSGPAEEPFRVPELAAPRPSAVSLNLLVVTHDLGYGGAQLWLTELLDKCGAGSAFPCTVVSLGGGPLVEVLTARGIEVHVTSPLPVDDLVAYEGRLDELSSWLDRGTYTAVLVNTFRAYAGADLAARRGLPVVWAIHESWTEPVIWAFDHPGVRVDRTVRELAARALRHAGAVIFEADATRALYDARAPGHTVVVHYGVDTAALDAYAATTSQLEARRSIGLDDEGTVLLVMGTIEPRKAQTLIAEAFASVPSCADAKLVLVGDLGTPYSSALKAYLRRAKLAHRVRVLPVTDDPLPWYRAADFLICGSDVESLPRSVLDAMGLGVAVIASSAFGLAELIVDGASGLLFEPNDLDAMCVALERAMALSEPDRQRLAAAGQAIVRQAYDSKGYAADIRALLDGLTADPGASPAALLASARAGSS